MITQLRDTQFGHLIRYLSGNKLFRYPDEVDTLLLKRYIHRDATSAPTWPEERKSGLDSSGNRSDANGVSTNGYGRHDVGFQDFATNPVTENGEDTLVVNWYGADDPEVRIDI